MITFGRLFVALCIVACLTDKALGGTILFLNLIALLIRIVSDLEAGREPSIKQLESDFVPSFEYITHFNDPESVDNFEDNSDIIKPISTASSESSYSQCSVSENFRENLGSESENEYRQDVTEDSSFIEGKDLHSEPRNGLHIASDPVS